MSVYGDLETYMNLYPNPSQGQLNLELELPIHHAKMSIRDLTGRLLWEKQGSIPQEVSIQLDLPAGIYLFSLETPEGKRAIQKIQVE